MFPALSLPGNAYPLAEQSSTSSLEYSVSASSCSLSTGQYAHTDAKGGVMAHHSGPLSSAGACACLVAAITLGAFITLTTLPELYGVVRITGLVAIMCSASSIVSSFAALY
ncbi:hypothetical protein BJ138DRAFT_1167255 [Hygrophoropsis aurantiaca]|uniref:Uncharacterized protein n=1 Tax=Hygrophoropsis aurantiaca TaxID=72124 RepID=A0ACB7ZTG2_9AGAM|nr:hypothetical protein BJ138DRAFT_1167255 [Hygrophoropsis aurantiaca]